LHNIVSMAWLHRMRVFDRILQQHIHTSSITTCHLCIQYHYNFLVIHKVNWLDDVT